MWSRDHFRQQNAVPPDCFQQPEVVFPDQLRQSKLPAETKTTSKAAIQWYTSVKILTIYICQLNWKLPADIGPWNPTMSVAAGKTKVLILKKQCYLWSKKTSKPL